MKSIKTVGALIDALQKFPRKTKLMVSGADCGGYDTTITPRLSLKLFTKAEELMSPYDLEKIGKECEKYLPLLSIEGRLSPPTKYHSYGRDWWDIFSKRE